MKEEQTPLGLVLYRNAMSLPLLLMIMAIKGESLMAPFTQSLPPSFYTMLALSSMFSFSIGFAVFMLQTEVRGIFLCTLTAEVHTQSHPASTPHLRTQTHTLPLNTLRYTALQHAHRATT